MTSLLCLVAAAAAQAPRGPGQDTDAPAAPESRTTADYLSDLEGEDERDRVAAARVLRGQLKRSMGVMEHAREGSYRWDQAASAYTELAMRLPAGCTRALAWPATVPACADILGWLEVKDALPPLRKAREGETSKGTLERLDAAIARIEAASEPVAK
jgi:hypothetical protein